MICGSSVDIRSRPSLFLAAGRVVFALPPLYQLRRTGFSPVLRVQLDHAAPFFSAVAATGRASRPLGPRSDHAVDHGGLVFGRHGQGRRRGQGSQGAQRGSEHGFAHSVAVRVPLKVVPVSPTPAVDELQAHGPTHVVIPAGEVAPAGTHLLGLHAVLFGFGEVDRAVWLVRRAGGFLHELHVAHAEGGRAEVEAGADFQALAARHGAGGPLGPVGHGTLGIWHRVVHFAGHLDAGAGLFLHEFEVARLSRPVV